MGASNSLLRQPDDWTEYAKAPWRSARSREIDRLGGLLREPIASGKSFDARLGFLGDVVLGQADEIQGTLFPERKSDGPDHQSKSASKAMSQALNRQLSLGTSQPSTQPPTRRMTQTPSMKSWAIGSTSMMDKQQLQEARRRRIEYGQMLSDAQSVRSGALRSSASVLLGHGRPATTDSLRSSVPARTVPDRLPDSVLALRDGVAPWRKRVFAARRRLILMLRVILRLKQGVVVKGRLRRVPSHSLFVGQVLGPAAPRFAEEQQRAEQLCLEMEAIKLLMNNSDLAHVLSSHSEPNSWAKGPTAQPDTTALWSGTTHHLLTPIPEADMQRSAFQGAGSASAHNRSSRVLSAEVGSTSFVEAPDRHSAPARTMAAHSGSARSSLNQDRLVTALSGPAPGPAPLPPQSVARRARASSASVGGDSVYGHNVHGLGRDNPRALAMGAILAAMEAVPHHQQAQWLEDALTTREQQVQQCESLMKMHINRANAKVAEESGPWSAPLLWDPVRSAQQWGHAACDSAVEDTRAALEQGRVAVMVMCSEDSDLVLPDGRHVDLWGVDPWRLVEVVRPGCVPPTERIRGVPLGARVILQLLASVAELAGPAAASKLTLLISCCDKQQADVMGDVLGRSFYGLVPSNVIILPQPSWPGHRYQPHGQRWERDPLSPTHTLGSGYAAFLLSWCGEGMTLSEHGELVPLPGSVIETLEARGIQWLVSERLRDLTLLSPSGALDMTGLTQMILLHKRTGANMGVWCSQTDSNVVSRQLDSLVVVAEGITRTEPAVGTKAPRTKRGQKPPRRALDSRQSVVYLSSRGETQEVYPPTAPTTNPMPPGLKPVVEFRHYELASPSVLKAVTQCKTQAKGSLTVGLHRYVFHLPSLTNLLVDWVFRARLHLSSTLPAADPSVLRDPSEPGATTTSPTDAASAELVGVTWDIADLMQLPQALCVPLNTTFLAQLKAGPALSGPMLPGAPPTLVTLEDIPQLVTPLQGQDHNPVFRKLLAQHQNVRQVAEVVAPVDQKSTHSNTIVVLIADINPLTDNTVAMACQLARPGIDTLHLVTVVNTTLAKREGQALLNHYHTAVLSTMVTVHMEVLVKHPWTLLDVLDWYLMSQRAGLLVMGSGSLTDIPDVASPAVLSSLTLAALRRLAVPVLVVTVNTRAPGAQAPVTAGAEAVAEASSRDGVTTPRRKTTDALVAGMTPAQAAVTAAVGAGGLKVLTVADHTSKPMFRWLCQSLHKGRGDTLLLAQLVESPGEKPITLTRQQKLNYATALDGFQSIASAARLPVAKRLQLFGSLDRQLVKAASTEAASLVALPLPPGRIPRSLLQLIQGSTAGVLVYKNTAL